MRLGETWKRQATRIGLIGALASLLLWPAYAILQEPVRWPFTLALIVTALSGVSILLITLSDIATVRRSRHALPARVFDMTLGAGMALPSLVALMSLA